MGCGKSTVGLALADRLGWNFVDLDQAIERQEAETISNIFATRGEEEFRRIESDVLKTNVNAVTRGRANVVALGGGTFQSKANIELVTNHGVPIWLDCPFEMVERRITGQNHRPLARDPEKFRALYDTRRAIYAQAEYRIEVSSDDPQNTVDQILALKLL